MLCSPRTGRGCERRGAVALGCRRFAGGAGGLGVEVAGVGEFVRVEVADGIATIRLDRPKMNALSA